MYTSALVRLGTVFTTQLSEAVGSSISSHIDINSCDGRGGRDQ